MGRRRTTLDRAAQVQALVEQTLGWNPQALELEIAKLKALFEAACLDGNRCFDLEPRRTFAAVAIELQNLQLAHAFEHKKQGSLDAVARRYVAFEYLHYRLLRCFIRKDRQADLYGLQFGDFGFAACAAIFLGAQKEARWLASEYVRHFDSGYRCPFTLDKDFLQTCRWISGSYLGVGSGDASLSGLYTGMAEATKSPWDASGLIEAVYDQRTEKAYRRLVLDDESEALYCGYIFPALIPFEMLAFERLMREKNANPIEPAHVAVAHLRGEFAIEGSWQDEFIARCEARLAQLEREVGVGPVIAER